MSTSYPPFLFLLILLLSTHVTFSLLFHIQNFHRRSGRSVVMQSKMTRVLTLAITEMWFLLCAAFSGLPLTRVWSPILIDCVLSK